MQLLPPRRTELRDQYFYPAACLPKNSEGRSYGTYKKKGDDCSSPVGAAGFEPATSWSQTRRDDRTTLRPELIILYFNCFWIAFQKWERKVNKIILLCNLAFSKSKLTLPCSSLRCGRTLWFSSSCSYTMLRRERDYLRCSSLRFGSNPLVLIQLLLHYVAEGAGFEPAVQLPVRQFSKLVVSATHPSLLSSMNGWQK